MVLAHEPHYEFNAGSICLDFVNTVWERVGYLTSHPAPPHELLHHYQDLGAWAVEAGLVSENNWHQLLRVASSNQRQAAHVFRRAIKFREALFGLCLSVVRMRGDVTHHLAELNSFVELLPPTRLAISPEGMTLSETTPPTDLELPPILICRDTVRLLTEEDLARLRICDAPDCGWVFLDRSKNNKRRWCDMGDCGNRDKVSRFLKKKRAGKVGTIIPRPVSGQ